MQTRFPSLRLVAAIVLMTGVAVAAPLAVFADDASPTPESTSSPTPTASASPTPTPTAKPSPTSAVSESTPTPTSTQVPSAAPAPPPGWSGCLDFAKQADAQSFFEANGGPAADPYGLDLDKDGQACENIQSSVGTTDASSPETLTAPAPNLPRPPRTGPRNTLALVAQLEQLTEYGVPLDQALAGGMGQFPVAGRANYFDDWLNPRYTPSYHLHQGLDIFAAFGTPIRAPDAGTVLRLSNNPSAGGIGVTLAAGGGTTYYFGHMRERADGLAVGQPVPIGTVIGYVGDTGNARGGLPHLHFEIRHDGVASPPKPEVDHWLDEALEIAPNWVQAREAEIVATRGPAPSATPAPTPTVVLATAAPAEVVSIQASGVTSRTYGFAGLVLFLASFFCASIVHRRRRPRTPRPHLDEYSLITA